jgi:ADP-ribosylglycohydrolase
MKDLNKFLWVMVGGAVWDALWAPVEFESIDNFDWVSDYKDGWWLNAWEWTDDTAMALLLADSLIRCKWFNIEDQLENYLKWHKTWYMWLRDFPEWEWGQVSKMMYYYEMYKNWAFIDKPRETDLSWEFMDWNWSLMRIWPVPLFFFDDPEKALFYAWESSKSTHYTDLCVDSCIYYTWLILWAMNWASKKELMTPYYSPVKDYRKTHKIADILKPIVEWSYKLKDRYQINPSWYVVETLETALWWFWMSESFEDWLEKVVNLWWDADTTWCIYWYLAWAYYWYDNIPERWKEWLAERDRIEETAKLLYEYNV